MVYERLYPQHDKTDSLQFSTATEMVQVMSSHAKVGDMEGAETWLLGMIDTWSQDIWLLLQNLR